MTEKKGGGLGKSPLGHFPAGPGDWPEVAEGKETDLGEAAQEYPN